jgi:phage-related protein
MSPFQAVYYRAADGSEPVLDLLNSLDKKRRVALRNQIARLNLLSDETPHLPFPHSSQVDGELRELRCHVGAEHYRVLYRRSERLLVLLHAFRKTTSKLPAAEVKVAQVRWQDFQERMNPPPSRKPRAAGHDAP